MRFLIEIKKGDALARPDRRTYSVKASSSTIDQLRHA